VTFFVFKWHCPLAGFRAKSEHSARRVSTDGLSLERMAKVSGLRRLTVVNSMTILKRQPELLSREFHTLGFYTARLP
jgi:hypothetical protein